MPCPVTDLAVEEGAEVQRRLQLMRPAGVHVQKTAACLCEPGMHGHTMGTRRTCSQTGAT